MCAARHELRVVRCALHHALRVLRRALRIVILLSFAVLCIRCHPAHILIVLRFVPRARPTLLVATVATVSSGPEPPRTPEPRTLELPNPRITLARSVRNEGASTLQQFSGDHSHAPHGMFHVKHSFPYALRPAGCGCAWASSVISSSGGMDFMGTAVQSIVRSCRRMASLSCALSLAGRGSVDVETGRGAASGREDGGWRRRGA